MPFSVRRLVAQHHEIHAEHALRCFTHFRRLVLRLIVGAAIVFRCDHTAIAVFALLVLGRGLLIRRILQLAELNLDGLLLAITQDHHINVLADRAFRHDPQRSRIS